MESNNGCFKTSASVVAHRTAPPMLRIVLKCLKREGLSKIFVVDNSPTDRLKAIVGDFKDVEYIHTANRGYGAAHNIALRQADDLGMNYHLIVNPDVRWDGYVVRQLSQYMDINPDVALAAPRTLYPDGSLQHTCRMLPTPFDLFIRRFLPSCLFKKRRQRYLLPSTAYLSEINSPYILGSFMLLRLSALREHGMFDERFFMYPEDIDITRRLHQHYRTVMLPKVSIVHDHARASRKSLKMMRIHTINMIRYFNKWGYVFDTQRKAFNADLLTSTCQKADLTD